MVLFCPPLSSQRALEQRNDACSVAIHTVFYRCPTRPESPPPFLYRPLPLSQDAAAHAGVAREPSEGKSAAEAYSQRPAADDAENDLQLVA